MSGAVKKPEGLFTYQDYLSWPEEEHWELIEGVVYDMSPAPNRRHQEIAFEISRQIANQLKGKPCKGFSAPFDVRLPEHADQGDDEVATVVQPDLVIVCDEIKLDDRGCKGAPDFVIEILSPYTMAKDFTVKLPLYERHGIREVWLISPSDRVVYMYRLNEEGTYPEPEIHDERAVLPLASVEGVGVDFSQVFGS